MERHLGGTTIFKLHTTIAEGPQVGPSLTRMNANVEPFVWCLSTSNQFESLHK